jgi:hypothetical protein
VIERHSRVATEAGIQRNTSVRKFDQPKIPIHVFHKDGQDLGSVTVRIPLEILTGRDCPVAKIASSCESFDHDVLDGLDLG